MRMKETKTNIKCEGGDEKVEQDEDKEVDADLKRTTEKIKDEGEDVKIEQDEVLKKMKSGWLRK